MKHKLLFSLLLVSAPVTDALGADVWSYADCVDYAMSHNITLQKVRLAEETAAYDLEEAKAQWEPTLDFATTHGFTNYPWGESGAKNAYNSSYGLNAGWTVWNGGARESTIKRNRLQTEISRLATGNQVRSLKTDLLQVYINILYARDAIRISEEAATLSGAQAERARQFMEAGKISKVDYAQLQAQYEQDCYAVVNARGVYDTRRMELKRLLELGIDSDIELVDVEWTAEQVLAELPPIDESFAMAVATDLQLQQLNLEKEGSALDVDLAKASGKPKISLNAGVGTGYSAPGNAFGTSLKRALNESVGLTLSVPILDNKKSGMAVAKAKVGEMNAQLDIDQRSTELSQEVENWYIDTRSAQARFEAGEGQLRAAELSHELVNERFNLGLVHPLELMSAHNTLVEARYSLLQARYMAMLGRKMIEYYRTADVILN